MKKGGKNGKLTVDDLDEEVLGARLTRLTAELQGTRINAEYKTKCRKL